MYGKICHHVEEEWTMRILGIERTKQTLRCNGQCEESKRSGRVILLHKSWGRERAATWESGTGGVSSGTTVMSVHAKCTQSSRYVRPKRSVSKVPVSHSPTRTLNFKDSHLLGFSDSPGELQRESSPSTIHGSCACSTLNITVVSVTGHPVPEQHRTETKC